MHANLIVFLWFAGIAATTAVILFGIHRLLRPQHAETEPADRLRQFPRALPAQASSRVGRFDYWLTRALYLSGLEISVATATAGVLLVGFALGGLAFVMTESPLLTMIGALVGMGAILGYVLYAYRRRIGKFQEQFPAALELLSRAVRAGESLDQAIGLLCESTTEPLATEFRRVSRQLEMGLSIPAAMESMNQRLGVMDVRIFSSAVSVHREAGGNIAETLERLARVIRDRRNYHRQMRAVTGAGRISVLVIAALGPVLFAYLFVFQPEYGQGLWEDPVGRGLLLLAIVLELAGLFWVSRLLKSDY